MQDIAIIMYNTKNNIRPPYIKDIFKLDKPRYGLSDFLIPQYNTTTYGRHSLRYVGPVIWSKLSKDVKNTESLLSLQKSKMKSKCCQITKLMDSIHAQSVF